MTDREVRIALAEAITRNPNTPQLMIELMLDLVPQEEVRVLARQFESKTYMRERK